MARFSASADLALNTHCLFSVKLTTKPASNDKAVAKNKSKPNTLYVKANVA